MRGKIVKVNKSVVGGGWGFISSYDVPYKRIFFYWTDVKSDFMEIQVGDSVEFEVIDREYPDKITGKTKIGKSAIKIEVINNPIQEAEVERIK